jgi:nicotinate-nucleotide adenylyltransferase
MICAAEARDQLGLDEVALVPVASPPHKEATDDPGAELRLALCRRAVSNAEGLHVLDIEVRRGGASYTVDTLRALHADRPGDELTFIVGGDMALSLPSWREPAEILRLARLGVAERSGALRADIEERLAPLGGRIDFFTMPRIDISSSDVRARAAAGRSVRWLVPDAVAREVEQRGMYA